MSDVPDLLTLKRHRDLEGRGTRGRWVARGIMAVIAAFCIAALANVFGQRPESVSVDVPAAKISVYAPSAVRGGDFMEARFHITAKQEIKNAILKLDPGWVEGMSMNTVEPVPLNQGSENGRLVFTLGHIPQGKSFILFTQFQVNPTNVAWNRPQNVELDDGNRVLATIHRTITVFP